MDLFVEKLDAFLAKKTEVVTKQLDEDRREREQLKGDVGDAAMTYDMNKFLKTVREFEADRAKKSKKNRKNKGEEEL